MSSVASLFTPNAQRIANVRRWFVDQSVGDDHVAALAVAITSDGRVVSGGSNIETEHAMVMIEELRALIQRIEIQLPEADEPMPVGIVKAMPLEVAKKAPQLP